MARLYMKVFIIVGYWRRFRKRLYILFLYESSGFRNLVVRQADEIDARR